MYARLQKHWSFAYDIKGLDVKKGNHMHISYSLIMQVPAGKEGVTLDAMKVVPMKGDGQCLFHSLSHFLNRPSESKKSRAQIVSWMKETREALVYVNGDGLMTLEQLLVSPDAEERPKEVLPSNLSP